MGDTKFTLIELHLDGDTQFGLGSVGTALPFGAGEEESDETQEYDTESETDSEIEADDEGSSGKAIGALLALVVLVGVAVAAKKFRGDDEGALEEEEQPDVIVN